MLGDEGSLTMLTTHSQTLTRKQAAKIIAATFPNYKGRKIRLEHVAKVTFSDTNWCEGSRSQYAAMATNGQSEVLNMKGVAPWNNPIEGKTFPLPPGYLIVEHTIFCGKDCGLTVYMNPDSAGELPLS
jgi:hypothetical protein